MSRYLLTSPALAPPRVADFRDAVRKVAGADIDATWRRLCHTAGVSPGAVTMSLPQLAALADAVTDEPGVLGVMGRSLAVRLTT